VLSYVSKVEEQIEMILHNLNEKKDIYRGKKVKTMNLTYLDMDSSEEERHVSPNASHRNHIVVHTGSTYRDRTVAVRSDLKSKIRREDKHCYDSSVAYVVD
jgi:hypothetical protein